MPDETQAASSPANPTEYLASLDSAQLADWRAGKLPEPQKAQEKPKPDGAAPSKEVTPKEDSTTSQSQSVDGAEKAPDKSAADSDAAKDQEPKKGKKDAQARILQLLAEKKAADKRAEDAERKLADRDRSPAPEKKEAAKEPEKKAESKAAVKETRPKPKQTDTNPDGTDKYASFADFTEDLADWKTEQRFEAFKAEQQAEKEAAAKSAKEDEKKQQQTDAQKAWTKKVEDAEKKYPDFKKVALNPDLPIAEGSTVLNFVDTSPVGMDVLQYLGENPDELMHINGLTHYEQLDELFNIAATFKASGKEKDDSPSDKDKPTVPVIRTTRSAKPPTEASGRTSAPDDPVEAAVRNRDPGAYMREMNRKEFAARQKKASG